MLIENRSWLSRSALRTRLSSVISSDEVEVDLLLREIEFRSARSAICYPFAVEEEGIALRENTDTAVYGFLLVASLPEAAFRKRKQWPKVDLGLDIVTVAALRAMFGENSKAIRFAWPASDGRPTHFAAAIDWLAEKLGVATGTGPRHSKRKDGGVDVVAWLPFSDSVNGFPVVLVQTTLSKRYSGKARDISKGVWLSWLELRADPIVALVIPFDVPFDSDQWFEISCDAQLILDRMRLCELLDGTPSGDLDSVDEIRAWTDSQLDQLAL